jgi:TrmH family RNA methyltransferase
MITSLHSSHVEAVKALLGSRGVKARRETKRYIVEGPSNIASLLKVSPESVIRIYYTSGAKDISNFSWNGEMIEVSVQVMKAMTDTVSPQGMLALVNQEEFSLEPFRKLKNPKLAYFWQIQDPGNAGTVIRTADAFGFDGVMFSDNSVDLFNPKVIRSTAGSFWQVPIAASVSLDQLDELKNELGIQCFITKSNGENDLTDIARKLKGNGSIWVFGNEARGIPQDLDIKLSTTSVKIPMEGQAESLNLATAASIVMYAVANA